MFSSSRPVVKKWEDTAKTMQALQCGRKGAHAREFKAQQKRIHRPADNT